VPARFRQQHLMARLVDIAELAGVSVGLVPRVLNDDPATRAAAETRERIVRVASELGYRPHYAARAL
jgi:LacI family transcriptional regulator, galactose operon repressor